MPSDTEMYQETFDSITTTDEWKKMAIDVEKRLLDEMRAKVPWYLQEANQKFYVPSTPSAHSHGIAVDPLPENDYGEYEMKKKKGAFTPAIRPGGTSHSHSDMYGYTRNTTNIAATSQVQWQERVEQELARMGENLRQDQRDQKWNLTAQRQYCDVKVDELAAALDERNETIKDLQTQIDELWEVVKELTGE